MTLDWAKAGGLIPAVIQDSETLQVLMLGYMSRESLEMTQSSGKVTFFSRTKNRIWTKGETSGNFLEVKEILLDCDADALLIRATPIGPTCHRETTSCFGLERAPGLGFLGKLWQVVEERYLKRPEGSYTTKLFTAGIDRMAQKVGEEGVEVALASKNEPKEPLKNEAADLLFHLMVLLRARDISFSEVVETLRERHAPPP